MPRRDQTGPMSEGERTGRGLGPCGDGQAMEAGSRRDRRRFTGFDEKRSEKMEFGLRQGKGLKRRGRGRRNDG